jgi:hypothetical protein
MNKRKNYRTLEITKRQKLQNVEIQNVENYRMSNIENTNVEQFWGPLLWTSAPNPNLTLT